MIRDGYGVVVFWKIATMKKNMGNFDRLARLVAAVIFIFLYVTGVMQGTAGIILIVLSVVFLLTSLISFCPLYLPFGINTKKDAVGK